MGSGMGYNSDKQGRLFCFIRFGDRRYLYAEEEEKPDL